MAAASTADGLTSKFNNEAITKLLTHVFWIGIGFFVGGVIDYTFFHNHPLGQEIIKMFEDYILPIFDFIAEVLGLDHLTMNEDMITETGKDYIPDMP